MNTEMAVLRIATELAHEDVLNFYHWCDDDIFDNKEYTKKAQDYFDERFNYYKAIIDKYLNY